MFRNEIFDSYKYFIKMIQNEILPSGFIYMFMALTVCTFMILSNMMT